MLPHRCIGRYGRIGMRPRLENSITACSCRTRCAWRLARRLMSRVTGQARPAMQLHQVHHVEKLWKPRPFSDAGLPGVEACSSRDVEGGRPGPSSRHAAARSKSRREALKVTALQQCRPARRSPRMLLPARVSSSNSTRPLPPLSPQPSFKASACAPQSPHSVLQLTTTAIPASPCFLL